MKTPAGKECRYYYADFHRGRNIQECRNVKYNNNSEPWHAKDCTNCPVPDILRANADPNMELTVTVSKGFMGFGRKIKVDAYNKNDGSVIENPYVGQVKDNPGLDIFRQALEDNDD